MKTTEKKSVSCNVHIRKTWWSIKCTVCDGDGDNGDAADDGDSEWRSCDNGDNSDNGDDVNDDAADDGDSDSG